VAGIIIFLTEVTSNTATAAAFLPLLGALALSQGVSPLLLTVPAAIAASCAFMMPVATPPNAIVFSSGHMQISDMIRAGFALNLMGIVVVTLISYVLLGVVFSM
jgi:sodium-dependent dicarboxylate transporter 2/3/5